MPGTSTSKAGVTNISKHGFWLLLDDRELFLSFDHFPWFKQATVDAILNLERPAPEHLRWPDLDVDLAVDSIEHPRALPAQIQALIHGSCSIEPAGQAKPRELPVARNARLVLG